MAAWQDNGNGTPVHPVCIRRAGAYRRESLLSFYDFSGNYVAAGELGKSTTSEAP
jgi:hypothetical protein